MASYYAVGGDACVLAELEGERVVILEQEVGRSKDVLTRLKADAGQVEAELDKLREESRAAVLALPRFHEQKRLAAKERRFRAAQEHSELAKLEEVRSHAHERA
jgi:hypothetical protein